MMNDVFIITLQDDYIGDTVDLYRVVGVRERKSICANKAFLSGMNSLEGRQFAFTEQEVINYAITDVRNSQKIRWTNQKNMLVTIGKKHR